MKRFRESRIDYDTKTISIWLQDELGNKTCRTYDIEYARLLSRELVAAIGTYDQNKDTYPNGIS